ncbi:MAG: winged helix-turn-helix domain-containing protein, partial [Verrucomicrobiales bacterium]
MGHYLKRWNFTPQKPIKRSCERNDKKEGKVRFMFYKD